MVRISKKLVTLTLLLTANLVYGASFDCTKAASLTERLICEDAQLSADDDELGVLYAKAKAAASDEEQFAESGREALRWREHNCSDINCLKGWYAKRRSALLQLLPLESHLPSASSPQLAQNTPDVLPHPSQFVQQPPFDRKFKSLLGSKLQQFTERLAVASPVERSGEWVLGHGCKAHNCAVEGAAFAVHSSSRAVYAAMYFDSDQYEISGFDSWLGRDVPEPLKKWAVSHHSQQPTSEVVAKAAPAVGGAAQVIAPQQSTPRTSVAQAVGGWLSSNIVYLVVLGALLSAVLLYGFATRCVACKKLFASREQSRDLLSRNTQQQTVTRRDEHKDASGKLTGTTTRKEQVVVEVSKYCVSYVCRFCEHRWTQTENTERVA